MKKLVVTSWGADSSLKRLKTGRVRPVPEYALTDCIATAKSK